MATRVFVNNSHTPHHSSNIPQATPSAKLSTSGAQPQNTSDSRFSLDDTVDRILVKAKSPLKEDEVRLLVEALEKMLEPRYPVSLRTRRRCFRGLVRICGERGILPSSYIIPKSKIRKLGDSPISSGGFSDVWPGAYEEEEEEEEKSVAIKVIRYDKSDDVRKIKKHFCREVITWKRLSHPNVLELIGVTMDDVEYSMVAPWMENGNIVEYLRENLQVNPLKLLEDAARGLQYLHSVELAHGDLKGGNILISEDGCACLADVGLTRVAGDLNSTTATSHTPSTAGANTVRWSPPELLDPERFGFKLNTGPTKKSDIYSMAMTIYEVLMDKPPFDGYRDLVAMFNIIEGVRPKKPIFVITRGYTEVLWEMTTRCWIEDPNERPTVDSILDALGVAAEQWKPRHGGLSTQSPQDDWSPTIYGEESDSPTDSELESEPATLDSLQQAVIAAPVPVSPLPAPSTAPPGPTHTAPGKEEANGEMLFKPIPPVSSRKEATKYAPVSPPQDVPSRRTLDEASDRILLRAESRLGEGEAREVVERFEKMLEPHHQIDLCTTRRYFQRLVEACGEYGTLPSSYIIPESKVQKLGDSPVSSGGFSDVWPGAYEEDEDEDPKCVAIKVIRYREPDGVQKIKKNFCREVAIWKRLSHPNILELIGVTVGDEEYSMVAPWMENGNIVEYLRENLEANPLKLLEDAARGLQYLHTMDLAHSDLKGTNILVSEEGRACLANFRLARVASDLNSTTTSHASLAGSIGALRWCPPELLDPERFGTGPTKQSDIYSMAMTIHEVLTEKPPFDGYRDVMVAFHILHGGRPKRPPFAVTRGYTEELWEMTTSCWNEDPTGRPTVDYVLDTLRDAAEQWKPEHGGLSTLSPRDDESPSLTDDSDLPTVSERGDEPTITPPTALDSPRLPVFETPVPTTSTSTPSVPPPLTAKYQSPPESVPATSFKQERIQSTPTRPSKEKEEPRPTPRKEEPIRLSRGEGLKPIPATPKEEGMRPTPVRPSRAEEEPRSNPATLRKDEMKPVPGRPSREEEPTNAKKEAAKHTPASFSEAQPKPIPISPRKNETKGAVPLKPTPATPKWQEAESAIIRSSKEKAPPKPAPKQVETKPGPIHPQKVEPKPRKEPFEREPNPPRHPTHVHRPR